jgi:acyl carrier protein
MITLEDIQKYIDSMQGENMIIAYNTRIIDLVLDSLELLELISYIENFHSVEIEFSEINGQMTMQEFIELIKNKTEKPTP